MSKNKRFTVTIKVSAPLYTTAAGIREGLLALLDGTDLIPVTIQVIKDKQS